MAMLDPKLIPWIALCQTDITEKGAISRFELWHVVQGEVAEKLDHWPAQDHDSEALAQVIWEAAEHDASTQPAMSGNRYKVLAFRLAEDEPDRAFPIKLLGQLQGSYLLGNESEPPTEKGALSQIMHHYNVMFQRMMQDRETTQSRLERENLALRDRLLKVESRDFELFELAENLRDRKHERELERAKLESTERRNDQWWGLVLAMVPSIGSKLLGINGLGANSETLSIGAKLKQLFEGLTEIEFIGMVSALKPHNQVPMLHLFEAVQEAKAQGGLSTLQLQLHQRALFEILRNLAEEEVTGMFGALKEKNRELAIEIYQAVKAIYLREQSEKPPLLRDRDLPDQPEAEEEETKH